MRGGSCRDTTAASPPRFAACCIRARLTIEYLQGRRARYLSPVRLYLIVSVVYFVVAGDGAEDRQRPANRRHGTTGGASAASLTAAGSRRHARSDLDDAPGRPAHVARRSPRTRTAFRARMFSIMPRVFFGHAAGVCRDRRAVLPAMPISGRAGVCRARPRVCVPALHAVRSGEVCAARVAVAMPIGLIAAASRFAIYASAGTACRVRRQLAEHRSQGRRHRRDLFDCIVPAFVIILIWASLV